MPPPVTVNEEERAESAQSSPITWRVRAALLGILLVLGGVFAVAIFKIDPYYAEDENGKREPWVMEAHTQLGLPACSFRVFTGKPCPACGLTTSFSLLLHGDPKASWKANWVGTLMAAVLLLAIPWGLAALIRGRLVWFRSLETALTWFVAVFLTLLMARWGVLFALDKLPTGG